MRSDYYVQDIQTYVTEAQSPVIISPRVAVFLDFFTAVIYIYIKQQ